MDVDSLCDQNPLSRSYSTTTVTFLSLLRWRLEKWFTHHFTYNYIVRSPPPILQKSPVSTGDTVSQTSHEELLIK